ncbi:hypothetical protein PIIN_01578 [Serendipita indica DSM 11827]|uniref:Uncharacterized protein n=1 Tax=Serendipita indica (strain DSM 11827) TaxID=1109443 RepID=G4T8V2_SERID|nr:hypothetical protein PIIN_01578 [Serendipita indica DSM 11827]
MPEQPSLAIHSTFTQYGPGQIGFIDDESSETEGAPVYTLRSLVKPFVIKQWVYRGKIYRERKERVPSRFELFFDLVFVAIAHQLSDAAAEHAGGPGLAQFILTFFPTWGLWNETRAFINASGTDDVLQRVGVLYMMALLLGYTANASAITLGNHGGNQSTSTESTAGESTTHAILAAVLAEGGTSAHTSDTALVTATAFFLLAKGLRIIFFGMYAVALPTFRAALLFQGLNQVIGFFLYFPLLFVRSPTAIITLASLGMAWEIIMRYSIGIYRVQWDSVLSRFKRKAPPVVEKEDPAPEVDVVNDPDRVSQVEEQRHLLGSHVPALNIEHFLERTAAFIVIVLGEMVLSVVYHATPEQVGFKKIYGNAVCGLIIAFNFGWLYFDAECSHRFLHALRRNWFTGLTFTNLHFPLSAALILAGAATSRMTQHEDQVNDAIRWYFGGGLGCAMISMALIGMLHRNLDPQGTTKLDRHVQLGFRLAVGIIMCCLPLSKLSPLELMGSCAGLTTFLVVEETYGKLHRGKKGPTSEPDDVPRTGSPQQELMESGAGDATREEHEKKEN